MNSDSLLPTTRNCWRTALALLLLFYLCIPSTRAQTQDDDELVRVNTNLIQLNVGVADTKGNVVLNLSRNDFTVYEDGVRQEIVSFEPAQSPFSLVLLLDASGSTLSFRPTLKQSALRFIDALSPEDRVAVVVFNDKVKLLQDFTTDRRKIAYAIQDVDGHGGTDFYDALKFALQQLGREGKRRKAIITLTDGVDTQMRKQDATAAAQAQTDEEAIASVKPEQSASLRAALDLADRQGVTVYPLALPSGDPRRFASITPQQAAIYHSARTRMQALANRTGGRLHEINRLEDMGRLYAEVAADMRTLYTIAYQSPGTRPRDGSWRAITIEVARPELLARTRPGYYAR
ncbi:MAG TPA: VWA domain-containing protein [Pyrinomonadaceae bacterium]|nr:VWA domain-containing protein [Pyrinomonadaceae bacterium]